MPPGMPGLPGLGGHPGMPPTSLALGMPPASMAMMMPNMPPGFPGLPFAPMIKPDDHKNAHSSTSNNDDRMPVSSSSRPTPAGRAPGA